MEQAESKHETTGAPRPLRTRKVSRLDRGPAGRNERKGRTAPARSQQASGCLPLSASSRARTATRRIPSPVMAPIPQGHVTVPMFPPPSRASKPGAPTGTGQ